MRYLAFATDYDGTLASGGRVEPETLAALRRVRDSGRRAILVTGRRLVELRELFLAEQAQRIERRTDLAPDETRTLIRNLIRGRYTLPA